MLTTPRKWLGPVVLLGLVLLPQIALAEAKVVVLDTVQATLKLKLAARQAVATALDELSVPLVPLEDLTQDDATCTDDTCVAALAKRLGATHVLLIQGVANPAGYRLSLDIRDGKDGSSLATDGKDCELCAEDQFAPTIEERVKKLWARVVKKQEEEAAAAAAPAEPPAPAPVPQAEPEETAPGLEVEAKPWWKQRTPLIGSGLAAAGVLLGVVGIYYVAVDGNTSATSEYGKPILLRDTSKWGWTFVGVGLVSAAAGTAMMIWGREDGRNVSVAVGPCSLGLQGKF